MSKIVKNNIYYAVVVIYNKSIKESITLKNLKDIKNHNIVRVVVDNSTLENINEHLCKEEGYIYLSMHGNVGLSKAYNKVLDYLKNKEGVVVWFDDDTNITQEYFDKLDVEINNRTDVSIFTPIIQGQDNKFWSPNEARFFKNKQLKNSEDTIKNTNFNAINSCTAVRLEIYKNYRYDERLFLDQIDHSFFYDMRKKKIKFCKIDVIIKHNFSLKNKYASIEFIKKRYEIMIPDFLVYCSKNICKLFLGIIKVLGWGIREGLRYKNPTFIFWCLNKVVKTIRDEKLVF